MENREVTQLAKDKEIKELTILEAELKSLKKGANVYQKQTNSDILFLSSTDKELAKVTEKIGKLKKAS
ncbi:hypothetical protein SNE40_023376 [Patella caerulea]|uniref:Uncharacterized protein n=1 Tax=Patella caerulea TaxID=87958 RepID=A0AAN8G6A9_PATCE